MVSNQIRTYTPKFICHLVFFLHRLFYIFVHLLCLDSMMKTKEGFLRPIFFLTFISFACLVKLFEEILHPFVQDLFTLH